MTTLFPLSESLAYLKDYSSKRISSYDKSGKNADYAIVESGQSLEFTKIDGAGEIRHIWFTLSNQDDLYYLRKVLFKAYWDDETEASIECPVGDFFGVGHAQVNPYWSMMLTMTGNRSIREAERQMTLPFNAGMNSFFPMPFEKNARLELINETDYPLTFYFYVDYRVYKDNKIDVSQMGRFHSQFRRENPTKGINKSARVKNATREELLKYCKEILTVPNLTGDENYVLLDAEGKGHYVGCNLSVHNLWPYPPIDWFGEGDDMIFIDGEKWPPSLHGTGTEDYFCAAWGLPSGECSNPFHGVSLAGNTKDWSGKWTVYRHHILDPIAFEKSIKVTIEHGHANNRNDDWSSVAYWYQREPHKKFPEMLPVEERLPRDTGEEEAYKILKKAQEKFETYKIERNLFKAPPVVSAAFAKIVESFWQLDVSKLRKLSSEFDNTLRS